MGLNGINSARSRTRPAYHMTTNQRYIKKGSGLVIRGAHSNETFLEGPIIVSGTDFYNCVGLWMWGNSTNLGI